MTKLFGLDIAQIAADAVDAAGGLPEGTLTKSVSSGRNPTDPTAGQQTTETTHKFNGIRETRAVRRADTLITNHVPVVTILGATVNPEATPELNDKVSIDGFSGELVRLIRADPAGATYEFEAQ